MSSAIPTPSCALAALLFATAAAAAPSPDCQCRAPDGQRRDLGTVACVDIGARSWLVRCEMSTNTPYWNRLRGEPGCEAPAA